jgi:hypothetical protein
MRKKLFITIVVVVSTAGVSCASETVRLQNSNEMKSIAIQIRGGRPSAEELLLRPTKSVSDETGFYMPPNLSRAAIEIEKMLPHDLLQKVRLENGIDSDFYDRDIALLRLSTWMYQNWQLDKSDSELGRELRMLGFDTPEWMGRALLEAVYEQGRVATRTFMIRLRRMAFIEEQDKFLPLSSPPRDCASSNPKINSNEIFPDNWKWRIGRTIYWIECKSGAKLAYLWERDWFSPDEALLTELVVN